MSDTQTAQKGQDFEKVLVDSETSVASFDDQGKGVEVKTPSDTDALSGMVGVR